MNTKFVTLTLILMLSLGCLLNHSIALYPEGAMDFEFNILESFKERDRLKDVDTMLGLVLTLLMAGGVAQGNKPGVFRGAVNRIKQTPVGRTVDSFMTKATQRWQQRTAAALISATLICGGITGCGTDNPMSVSAQNQDLTGWGVAYEDASGVLRTSKVIADHGDILTTNDPVDTELHQSEVLGIARAAHTFETIVINKGNYLDAYGDRFAEVEYLIGGISSSYYLNGEPTVLFVRMNYGDTASGEEIDLHRETGGSVDLLIRANEVLRYE